MGKDHTVSVGLHYFNGLYRLSNQSTLNMMMLDNNFQSWSTIDLSDQFAGKIFAGYVEHNVLDQESNFLPYQVETYLGGKNVFNMDAEFPPYL